MKTILTCLSLLVTLWCAGAHPFLYMMPLPDSKEQIPNRTLIIHPGYTISSTDSILLAQTQVSGSLSGNVSFQLKVLEQNTVAVFKFDNDFQPGETVTVQFNPQLKDKNGNPTNGFTMSFEIRLQNPPPSEFVIPPLTYAPYPLTFEHTTQADTGYIVTSFVPYEPSITLRDNNGTIIEDNGIIGEKLYNIIGDSLFVTQNTLTGVYYIRHSNFNPKDSFTTPLFEYDLHEVTVLPNGNYLNICFDKRYVDMSQIVTGGKPNAIVRGQVVQEVDNESHESIFEWTTWDGNMDITDAIGISLNGVEFSATHLNALDYRDGYIYVSSYAQNSITKIDHRTGEKIWTFGGNKNQFTFIDDPDMGTSRQHNVQRLPNGNLLVFDNGLTHPTPHTSAKEYTLNDETKTAQLIWSCPSPNTNITVATGSVQRLPSGNTVIGWGTVIGQPTPTLVSEVTAECEVVLTAKSQLINPTNRDMSYRSMRTTMGLFSSATHSPAPSVQYIQAYPNPTPDKLWLNLPINTTQPVPYTITNILGQVVAQDTYTQGNPLSTAQLPSGMYYIAIQHTNTQYLAPFIKN
jgi:hypothetical protein